MSDNEIQKESPEDMATIRQFALLIANQAMEQIAREEKLKFHPKGFPLEKDGSNCCICHEATSTINSWYDENGIKCLDCQRALDDGIIPTSLCTDGESFYSDVELEIFFKLKGKVLNGFIKKGIIKCRMIPRKQTRSPRRLFLLSENKDFLPPKILVRSQCVKEVIDDREEFVFAPWYWCCDNPSEYLSSYGISHYLVYELNQEK